MDNYFQKWLNDNMTPCAIVYSTDQAKTAIKKNNLSPSEFLRPFGDYKGLSFNMAFCDSFSTVLESFRLDFFDSEVFEKKSNIDISQYMLNAITNPKLIPDWNIDKAPQTSKKYYESILSNVIDYSFPWYYEAEKTFLELSQFNELEMLQQPFLFVYLCALTDPPEIINDLKDKQTPKLLSEGIYESKIVNLILLLNDNSNKEQNIKASDVDSYVSKYQKAHHTCPQMVLDINTQETEDNALIEDDIWDNYIHKVDLYSMESNTPTLKSHKPIRGRYISNRERDNNKLKFVTFMSDVLKPNILNIIKELDDEVTAKRKNPWKSFQKLFQNKNENALGQLNYYQIYKLSPIEKSMYLLSIIQFYFHDYADALKNLELLYEDLKNKSKKHQNAILQLITICQFMIRENKRKVDIDLPFKTFMTSYEYQSAFKAFIIQIKMMEQMKQYSEICSLLVQSTINNIYPWISPLLNEKAGIYHLINNKYHKYSTDMFTAAELYKSNSSNEYQLYAIKCFGALFEFCNKIDFSFPRLKLYINQEMMSLCSKRGFNESAVIFSKNCVETLKYHPQSYQIQSDFFTAFLKTLSELPNEKVFNKLSFPEIDNSSVLIVEGQDELICSSFPRDMIVTYNNFTKYTKVYVKPKYIPLTKNDMKSFNFIDSILSRKVITNYYLKRHYLINTNDTIYVKLALYNPFNIPIEIKAFKLIFEILIESNEYEASSDQGQLTKEDIINDSIDIVIEEYIAKDIQLSFTVKKRGVVFIKGVEMKLFGVASVIHLFSHHTMNKLYDYHSKRKEYLSSLKHQNNTKTNSNTNTNINTTTTNTPSITHINQKHKGDFTLEVIDANKDLQISLPLTNEVTAYCNELVMMPVVLSNNANLQVNKFTVFLHDITETDKRNRNVLCDYIHTVDWDLSKEKREVIVPIVPLTIGVIYIKVVVKFEDEYTFKELEAKRFVIKLNVLPSIDFNIKEKLLFWNEDYIDFSLNANAHIVNRSMLSLMQIDSMYINPQYKFIQGNTDIENNNPSMKNWNIIDKDSYYKLYSEFKIRKSLSGDDDSHTRHHSSKDIIKQQISFLSNDNKSNQPQTHIESALNQLIADDHLILHWTSRETNDKIISGLIIHKLSLKMPKINSESLHSLLSNLVQLNVDQEKGEGSNETFVTLNYTIQVKPIEELKNFLHFNMEADQSIRPFNWIGLRKFIYDASLIKKYVDSSGNITVSFSFVTQLKGIIDVNKVAFKMYFSDNPNQPVVVLKVPQFQTIEIK